MTRIKFVKKEDRTISELGKVFGAAAMQARIDKGWTHYDASKHMNCSMALYRDVEGGWFPDITTVIQIAKALDLSLDAALLQQR